MKAFTKVVSGAQRSRSNSVPNVLKSVSGPVLNNSRRRLSASPPSLSTIPEKLILAQRRKSISHFACDFVATEKLTAKAALPRKITWLIGAPGSGKGTNSAHVNSIFGYKAPTIVMSSLLETPEFKQIKDSGGMVGDELVFDILLRELAKPQYRHGVVVDGFPRTERQAKMLTDLFENNAANTTFDFVMLHTDEETSVARQLARGEGVKKLNALRKENGLPTVEERATDTCINTARKRYSTFLEQYGVVEKLSNSFTLHVVDASSSLDVVQQRLTSTLTSTLPTLSKSHLSPLTQAPNLSRLSSPLTASPSPLRNAFHHELLSSNLVNSSSSNHRMVFI